MTAEPAADEPPAEASEHYDRVVRRVARGGTLNLVGTAVTAGLVLLQSVVVSHGASTSVAGVFFTVTSAAVILTTVAVFGAETSLPRFIPLLRAQGRRAAESSVVSIATAITVGVSLVLWLGLLVAPPLMRSIVGPSSEQGEDRITVGLLAVCVPLAALALVWIAATRAHMSIRPTVIVEKVGKSALQLACLVVALSLGASSVGLVAAWLVPTALVAIPAYLWLRRITSRGRGSSGKEPSNGPTEGLVGDYLAYTAPRALQSGLQITLQRVDIIVVAAMLSPSDAAIYALATRFIVLGQFAAGALQQVVAPHLSSLFAEGRPDSAMSLARTVTVWTVLLVWPVYLFSISNGGQLLGLLGGTPYEAGATALAVLSAGMLFASMTGPVDTILLMAGRSVLSLSTTAVALVVDLTLLIVLVPEMGIVGAALAWCMAICTKAVLNLILVKRTTGSFTFGQPLATAIGVTMASFLVVPVALGRLDLGPGSAALMGLGLSTLAYFFLVWRFRRRLDLSALISMRRSRPGDATPLAGPGD